MVNTNGRLGADREPVSYKYNDAQRLNNKVRIVGKPGISNSFSIYACLTILFLSSFYTTGLVPEDEEFDAEWQLGDDEPASLNLPPAWDSETGRHSIVVAVIDSGVSITNPNLKDQIWTNPLEWLGSFDHHVENMPPGIYDPPGIDDFDDDTDTLTDFDDLQVLAADYDGDGTRLDGGDGLGGNPDDLDDLKHARYDENEDGIAAPGMDEIDDDLDGFPDFEDSDVLEADYDNDGNTVADGDKEDIYLAAKDDDENGFVDDFHGWNFDGGNNDVTPSTQIFGCWHGTYIAGLIAADMNDYYKVAGYTSDNFQYVGIAQITIMPIKIFKGNSYVGEGMGGSLDILASGIRYAYENGADILSISYGVECPDADTNPPGSTNAILAIQAAYDQGCLIVAAAGNYRYPYMIHMPNGNPPHIGDSFVPNDEQNYQGNIDDDFEDFNQYKIPPKLPSEWPGWDYFDIDQTYHADGMDFHFLIETDIDDDEVNKVIFPANNQYVLTVGASNYRGHRCSYSYYQENKISVMAPCGDYAVSQQQLNSEPRVPPNPGGQKRDLLSFPIMGLNMLGADGLTGTSYACPEVSALAALVWTLNPRLTNYEVRQIIQSSADDVLADEYPPTGGSGPMNGYDKFSGWGLINPKRAVEYTRLYIDNDNFEDAIQITAGEEGYQNIKIKGHSMDIDTLGCTNYVYSTNINDPQNNNPNHRQQIRYELIDRNGEIQTVAKPWVGLDPNKDAEDPCIFLEPHLGYMNDMADIVWRGQINGVNQKGDIFYRQYVYGGIIVFPPDPPVGPGPLRVTNDPQLMEGPPKVVGYIDPSSINVLIAYPQQNALGQWDIYGTELLNGVLQPRFAICNAAGDQKNVNLGLFKDIAGHYIVNIMWEDTGGGIYYAAWDLTSHQFVYDTGNNGRQIQVGNCNYLTMATEYDILESSQGICGIMHVAWVTANDIYCRRIYINPANQIIDIIEKVQLYRNVFDPSSPADSTIYTGQVPKDLVIDYDQFGRSHLIWVSQVNNAPLVDGVYYTSIGPNGKPCNPVGQTPLRVIGYNSPFRIVRPIVKSEHDIKTNIQHAPYMASNGQIRIVWIKENTPGGYPGKGEYTTSRPIWETDNIVKDSTAIFKISKYYDFIIDHQNWKTLVVWVWEDDEYSLRQYTWQPTIKEPTLANAHSQIVVDGGIIGTEECYPRIASCWDEETSSQFYYITYLIEDGSNYDLCLATTNHDELLMASGGIPWIQDLCMSDYDITVYDKGHNLGLNPFAADTDELWVAYIDYGTQGYTLVGETWIEVTGRFVSLRSTKYDLENEIFIPGSEFDLRPTAENPGYPYFQHPAWPRIELDVSGTPHLLFVECPNDIDMYGDIWYIFNIDISGHLFGKYQLTASQWAYYPDFVLERNLFPRYLEKTPSRYYMDGNRRDDVLHIVWRTQETVGSETDYNLNYAKLRYFWGYDYVQDKKVLRPSDPFEITYRTHLIVRDNLLNRGNVLEERLDSEMGPPRIVLDFENNVHIVVMSDLFDIYLMNDGIDNDYTRRCYYILIDHGTDDIVSEEAISIEEGDNPIPAIELTPKIGYNTENTVNALVCYSIPSTQIGFFDLRLSRHSMIEVATQDVQPYKEFR